MNTKIFRLIPESAYVVLRRAHGAILLVSFTALPVLTGCSVGEELGFGESAIIQLRSGATVEVAVTASTPGDTADFSDLQDPSTISGKTPYYVKYTVTRTNDKPISFSDGFSADSFSADDGSRGLENLQVIGGIPTCKEETTSSLEHAPVGTSVSGCVIFLASSGIGEPTSIEFYTARTEPEEVTWTK